MSLLPSIISTISLLELSSASRNRYDCGEPRRLSISMYMRRKVAARTQIKDKVLFTDALSAVVRHTRKGLPGPKTADIQITRSEGRRQPPSGRAPPMMARLCPFHQQPVPSFDAVGRNLRPSKGFRAVPRPVRWGRNIRQPGLGPSGWPPQTAASRTSITGATVRSCARQMRVRHAGTA